jgi:hypothetical protein
MTTDPASATDTDRLDWVIGQLTRERPTLSLVLLGLPPNALDGPGEMTVGSLFRQAVDREMARGAPAD